MDLVTDFLLLAASATACLYCFVLNRRLKGLTSAREGLGAGIAALSRSAEEMKSAVSTTRQSADAAAARIETLLGEADEKTQHLQKLIDELSEMSSSVVAHAEGATKKYVDTIAPFLGEANDAAARLLEAIERAPSARPAAPIATPKRANADVDVVTLDDTAARISAKIKRASAGAAA
ncbi:MAG: hypothetical protein VX640_04500 [Pseudomonadota bacterium]|nr:hypothetical protein [Pseudomonadota bacterium]